MKSHTIASLAILVALAWLGQAQPPLLIHLPGQGQVQGYLQQVDSVTLQSYRNIPFAQPPVGPLRWQPAVDGFSWTGVRDGTQTGNACIQNDQEFGAIQQSEDCLNLNVFVPSGPAPAGGWPVMVWLYGGSNIDGYNAGYGGPEAILRFHKHIVVAPNYRLGALGYLALEELSQNDVRGVSGNYGITDILSALRWVKANIGRFGGDKDKVTVVGQSSGGTNILALHGCPSARGLFSHYYSYSASPNLTQSLEFAEPQHRAVFLAVSTCNTAAPGAATLACLYSLQPADIVAAQNANYNDWSGFPIFPSSPAGTGAFALPIVDGVTVAIAPQEGLKRGMLKTGGVWQNNIAEVELDGNDFADTATWSQMQTFIQQNFAPFSPAGDPSLAGDFLLAAYNADAGGNARLMWDLIGSDATFGQGTTFIATQAGIGAHEDQPVYLAYFSQQPSSPYPNPFSDGTPGTQGMIYPGHATDWAFMSSIFTLPFQPGVSYDAPYSPVPAWNFNPQASDIAIGAVLRKALFDLIDTGSIEGATPVNGVFGAPNAYSAMVFDNNVLSNVINYRKVNNDALYLIGVGQSAWIVN